MLIDHTYNDRVIKPEGLEDLELLSALKRKLPKVSFDKVVRIIDQAIEHLVGTDGRLTFSWGCAGSLLGYSSQEPHCDIEYLWDKVIETVGPDRFCKMAVGALLQWRVAKRAEELNEDWHAYKREYEEEDEETGKKITRYEYWVTG